MAKSDGPSAEFLAFKQMMERLIAVPKKEIDRQAAAWKRRKNKNKKASPGQIVT